MNVFFSTLFTGSNLTQCTFNDLKWFRLISTFKSKLKTFIFTWKDFVCSLCFNFNKCIFLVAFYWLIYHAFCNLFVTVKCLELCSTNKLAFHCRRNIEEQLKTTGSPLVQIQQSFRSFMKTQQPKTMWGFFCRGNWTSWCGEAEIVRRWKNAR